jgi:coniferyl-aldehyde dehydrogenase
MAFPANAQATSAQDPSGQAQGRDDLGTSLNRILAAQKAKALSDGPLSEAVRKDWLDRAIGLLVDFQKDIVECLAADFGHRSTHASLVTDVFGAVEPLRYARKHVGQWMRPERRRVQFPLNLLGGRARIEYQAKGVIGIISPWNFPVNLTFGPLAGAFAAGNRVMIKPSEFTPATSELMQRMLHQAFDETEVAVVTGGPAVGEQFSRLAFDHLLFTGATSVARHVMRAASENLVPVTLELGGKSPVIVSKSADIAKTATKIMSGKTLNAGQICLAPDYVLVPENARDDFVAAAKKSVAQMYPTLKDNPDYTSIVNQRHFDRLHQLLADARQKGATIIEINPAHEDFSQQMAHKIPPTLVLDPTDDMDVMRDEIFGPILPIKTYRQFDETIDYINAHPRPLGLYHFGDDQAETRRVLDRTVSGGVTLGDVLMHFSIEDLPFGGIGPAGMGSYHGIDGFRAFSHAKSIYSAPKIDAGAMIRPPYGKKIEGMMAKMIKR